MRDSQKKKPSYDVNRQVLGKIFPLDTPFTVILDVSELCQFRCRYCFRSDSDKRKWGYAAKNNLMSWEIFCKAVGQISEFRGDVKQISLSNHGEPLCNRQLPQMIRYIKDQGINSRTSIHTNAALLDEQYAVELAESGISRIVVSLQGLTEKKYKDVCGIEIDYDRFYRNLKLLYETKTDTQICIKIADIALEKGEEDKFYEMYEPIADRVFIEEIVPIWIGVETGAYSDKVKNKYGDAFSTQECCPLIFHTIVITPDGDVYPCTQLLREEKLGNINENSLVKLWTSSERQNLLLQQCDLRNPAVCEECFIRQNSIYTKADMIDNYRLQIKERLLRGIGGGD